MTSPDASRNMRLLAHHDRGGFGSCGAGPVIQLARGGRYGAHKEHEARPAPGAVRINTVFVDECGNVYAVDRLIGGLCVLELGV